jgi:hypothetical protein
MIGVQWNQNTSNLQHYIASIWNIGKLIICLIQKHYIHLIVIAPLD